MSSIETEIAALEERLRLAELGPDPAFFEEILADNAVMVSQSGEPMLAKKTVVEAHQPGKYPTFTRVEMTDMKITAHENAAVVTCTGNYENAQGSNMLKFMRVWLRRSDGWKIIAGSIFG
jgi:hypothetical protein